MSNLPPQNHQPQGHPPQGANAGPNLEQIISNLPPEVLQQLVAELEQLASGQQGEAPQAEPQPKIAAETPEYIEAFFKCALDAGFDKEAAVAQYNYAYGLIKENPIPEYLAHQEKRAQHFEGFYNAAIKAGASSQEAQQAYATYFGNI